MLRHGSDVVQEDMLDPVDNSVIPNATHNLINVKPYVLADTATPQVYTIIDLFTSTS